MPIDLDETIN